MDKTDRQIAAIQKLIVTSTKMIARRDKVTDARFRAVDEQIRALADAQQRTEKKLDRLIEALLGRGPERQERQIGREIAAIRKKLILTGMTMMVRPAHGADARRLS